MIKLRNRLSGLLSRAGGLVFHLLSVLESKNRFSRTTRHFKLVLLGGLLSLIGCLTHRHYEPAITCYYVHFSPPADEIVDSLLIYPNPTRGADSVTIKVLGRTEIPGDIIYSATAAVSRPDAEPYIISLDPVDGKFDSSAELLEARLDVRGLPPETVRVFMKISSLNSETSHLAKLIVSKPDTSGTEKKEDN